MGAHYVCTTAEGIADVIARTAPPAEPLDIPDFVLKVSGRYGNQEAVSYTHLTLPTKA